VPAPPVLARSATPAADAAGLVATTYAERPDLIDAAEALVDAGWPAFMSADPVEVRCWDRLAAEVPELQVVLLDPARGVPVAVGNAVPFAWDGDDASLPADGWDHVLSHGVDGGPGASATAAASALAVTIDPAHRGRGLSRLVLDAMRAAAAARGCTDLVAPVRPNHKARHPLVPLEEYVTWLDPRGRPADPWLRVHTKMGATIVGICPRSMTIPGTLAEWAAWTGLRPVADGPHVIPGGLVPVEVDRAAGIATYVEPNVWVRHRLDG
jgi:GNAT superfamily N-acetyltransferase